MAKKEKKNKEELQKPSENNHFGVDIFQVMTPKDVRSIGTDNDPCFGKSYDLTTSECKKCGDSELCSIAFSMKMKKERRKINVEEDFKDIELEIDKDKAFKYIRKLKKNGEDRKSIIKSLSKEFDTTTEIAGIFYKKWRKDKAKDKSKSK